MFTDEMLEKIYTDSEVRKLPIGTQATMIKAIERIIDEEQEKKNNDAIHKSKLF